MNLNFLQKIKDFISDISKDEIEEIINTGKDEIALFFAPESGNGFLIQERSSGFFTLYRRLESGTETSNLSLQKTIEFFIKEKSGNVGVLGLKTMFPKSKIQEIEGQIIDAMNERGWKYIIIANGMIDINGEQDLPLADLLRSISIDGIKHLESPK